MNRKTHTHNDKCSPGQRSNSHDKRSPGQRSNSQVSNNYDLSIIALIVHLVNKIISKDGKYENVSYCLV
jgi:hypothetical protein